MAGLARSHAGQVSAARRSLVKALARSLSEQDRTLAERTLQGAGASAPPATGSWTGWLSAYVGGGFDSNVLQGGRPQDEGGDLAGASSTASPFASLLISLGGGPSSRDGRLASELGYSFTQLAYTNPKVDDFSYQEHALDWYNLLRATHWLRFSAIARGEYSFVGLARTYRPFLLAGGAEAAVAIGRPGSAQLRASGSYAHKRSRDPDYAYLSGDRWQGQLEQQLVLGGFTAAVSASIRWEAIGHYEGALGTLPSSAGVCPGCPAVFVTPYAHQTRALALGLSSPAGYPFRLWARGRIEDRPYLHDAFVEGRDRSGRLKHWDVVRRHDRRYGGGVDASVKLGRHAEMVLRYDVMINRSNLDGAGARSCLEATTYCHPMAYDNWNYVRHVASLEVGVDW